MPLPTTGLIDDLVSLLRRSRPVPADHRAARLALGSGRAAEAAGAILRWLALRATDHPLHPALLEKGRLNPNGDHSLAADLPALLAGSKKLSRFFEWTAEGLDFRPEASRRARRLLEARALGAMGGANGAGHARRRAAETRIA